MQHTSPPGGGDLAGLTRRRWRQFGLRRIAIVALAVLVAAGIALAVTDPFTGSGAPNTGVADNGYPTALATVSTRSLSQQTDVSATLGYSGSYSVAIPSGTTATAVAQAQAMVQTDRQKLAADEQSLSQAKRLEHSSGAATILDAKATVTSAETSLAAARAQLSEDEQLDCPASSSATVTTPSSSGSGGGNGGGTGAGTASAPNAGIANSSSASTTTAAPTVTTGAGSTVTATSEALAGTVDPNGLATNYYFEWGSTSSYGFTTATTSAGDGTDPVSVTATITGLSPNATYDFALVAINSLGTSIGQTAVFQTAQSSCVAERTVVTEDVAAVTDAKDALAAAEVNKSTTVTTDELMVTTDQQTLSSDEAALSTAETAATNPGSVFTSLPKVGAKITRGQAVYWLGGRPVPLFYGTTTPYRALYLGVSDGPDVTQLQENLIALGFGAGITTDAHFSAATAAAVEAWQRSIGAPATGEVALGDVVVEPTSLLISAVSASLGQAAAPGGAVLTASSTTVVVTVALDANLASTVKVGDQVSVTLPNNSVISGTVSSIGTVATTPTGNTGAAPTVPVLVTLGNPAAAGGLDQASVEVAITTGSVSNVLAVPVDSLLSLAGGGYAVEEVTALSVHTLVPVSLGLFDDAAGYVQVSGPGLAAGQRIVVPAL